MERAERALAAAQARLAELRANYHSSLVAAEHEQLLVKQAQVQALRQQIEAYRIEAQELRDRLSSSESQIDLLHQQLGTAGATPQNLEDAVLREHINKVAADLVRLTATLEGAGSPIASIVAGGAGSAVPASGTNEGETLAISIPEAKRQY